MKRLFFFVCSLFFPLLAISEEIVHEFAGKHFLASYLGCSPRAVADLNGMLEAMDKAVNASGASILDRTFHIFPPNGLTAVYMLSESHASIHTYPENQACFVDLFTCGDRCSSVEFDQILREYLQPAQVNARQFIRHEGIEEILIDNF